MPSSPPNLSLNRNLNYHGGKAAWLLLLRHLCPKPSPPPGSPHKPCNSASFLQHHTPVLLQASSQPTGAVEAASCPSCLQPHNLKRAEKRGDLGRKGRLCFGAWLSQNLSLLETQELQVISICFRPFSFHNCTLAVF